MTLLPRLSDPTWWQSIVGTNGGSNAKNKKNLKKAEGRVLFVDEACTLSSKSRKDYGKETIEAMMAKMNANIDIKTKTHFLYLLGIP